MAAATELGQAFIVGAQRCGTTSVATALARHREVALAQPLRPEPKWFLVPGSADTVDAYLARHYPEVVPAARLLLEKSTSYFGSDVACTEIARAFPDAQLIVVLRDPVDRARRTTPSPGPVVSRTCRSSRPSTRPPSTALRDRSAISVSPYRYLSRGRYIDDLRRWDETFGPDAVHVVILEDVVAEPERFAALEAALGLAPGPAFVPGDRHNAGEGALTLDDGTRARLADWFADANTDLAERLGRPIERWSHA